MIPVVSPLIQKRRLLYGLLRAPETVSGPPPTEVLISQFRSTFQMIAARVFGRVN